MSQTILMVEDDSAFRAVYAAVLREAGIEVVEAEDRPSARAALAARSYPVVLLDLMLPPDGSARAGLDQMREVIAGAPGTKVIVASGAGDAALMVEAVRGGAYDFLTKPVDPDALVIVIERALTRWGLEQQVESLRATLQSARPEVGMVGGSPAFRQALDMASRVAVADLPVLVTGESGTGKELMARAIHDRSQRSARPFVVVNCGGLPESLLESTLFGHVRGAFTGANRDRAGLFAEAHTGTLFLDEVGDMPASLQVKLLRTLESGEVRPVGADRPHHVDVRLVSATHRDLQSLRAEGTFRDDLYWRLRGAEIRLPPLRERVEDIGLLAEHFLARAATMTPDGRPRRLSPGALERLEAYGWPGNLRELRHELLRATVLAGVAGEIGPRVFELAAGGEASGGGGSLAEQVAALETRVIRDTLAVEGGNRTRTADRLGLSRQGLLNKLARYGLGSDSL